MTLAQAKVLSSRVFNFTWEILHRKEHFIIHQMKIFVPLHEWETFIICFTKIKIFKQI